MALGSITIDLLLKTGAFDNDAKRAEKRLAELGKSAKAAGVMIGTAFSAAVLGASAAIKSSINAMDDMSKAALRAGASTEEFSKLAYAGDLADVAMSDLVGSLGKLQKAQGDALKETSQQAKIFDALGISVKNADGSLRGSTDVLYDFADAYKALDGSPEATAAGMAIFGRSFQNLIPLIKDGSQGLRDAGDELERFGGVLSTEAGQQAEAFNDNLSRLTRQSGIFWQLMASNLLPDLERLSAKFVDNAAGAERMNSAAEDAANMVRTLVGGLQAAYSVVDFFGNGIESITQRLYGFYYAAKGILELNWAQVGRGLNMGFTGGSRGGSASPASPAPEVQMVTGAGLLAADKAAIDAEVAARKKSRDLQNQIAAAMGDTEKVTKSLAKSTKDLRDVEADRIKALNESYEGKSSALQRELDLFGNISEVVALRYEIEKAGLDAVNPELAKKLLMQQEELEAAKDLAAIEGVWADGEQSRVQAMVEDWTGAADAMSVYAEQAGRNMQDAFADFLFDPFKDGLDGMLENFAKILQRMAAEMAASKIFEAMGTAGAANSGTWWGSLLSAFGGTKKAAGGYIAGPGTATSDSIPAYLSNGEYVINASAVSQYGKNFFDGLNAKRFAGGGHVGPANNSVPGMAGGGEVNVNVYNAPAGADVQTRKNDKGGMDIDVILRQVDQYIGGNVASGSGATYSSMKNRFGLREAI